MEKIRVLIADDHTVVRKGIRMIATTDPTVEIVGEAKNGREAVRLAKQLQPDIILIDLVMPKADGIEAITRIKPAQPDMKIIVLTTFEDSVRISSAIEAGADGYLLKDADGEALLQAIRAACQGELPLSPRVARQLFTGTNASSGPDSIDELTDREQEVLQWVALGLSNKQVAEKLDLTEGTVKVHVSHILGKLNVPSRTKAAVWAAQVGLVPSTSDSI